MTRPRRSTRITGRHHYHEAVRPCAAHQYSTPSRFPPLGALPSMNDRRPQPLHWPPAGARRQVHTFHTGAQTKLAPPPRRRPPGQYSGIPQAHPGPSKQARFRSHRSLSTRQQWFALARLPGPHLPRSTARRFPQRSPPRLLTAAACGGLQPPPEGRLRRTTSPTGRPLHLRYSTALIDRNFYSGSSSRFVFTPWIWDFSTTQTRERQRASRTSG